MPSNNAKKPRNRRLDPEVRKQLILDRTAELIAKEGISAVSMERVGRETGVSKALVYAYFQNQNNLLQQLLLREQENLSKLQAKARAEATTFDALVQRTTRTYLEHVQERGLHVQRLMNEPAIASAFREAEEEDHQRAVDVIAKEMVTNFGIPEGIAIRATEMSMGLTAAAGDQVSRETMSVDEAEELSLTLLRGAVGALHVRYAQK
ncbi:MAG: TetR/AcrR family transcriptional regulator [Parvularculaceae bacterium]|nr:TetR/AcrR family transcriptional regulator [Parvularculaceae bacterium]